MDKENQHIHTHHRHHSSHHHDMNDSENFKQTQLRNIRFKKVFMKTLYTVMMAAAIIVMMGVFYAYVID